MEKVKLFMSALLLGFFVFLSLCCATSDVLGTPTGTYGSEKDAAEMHFENSPNDIEPLKL